MKNPNFTYILLARLLPVGLDMALAVMQSSTIALSFLRAMTRWGRWEETMKKMKKPNFTQILLARLSRTAAVVTNYAWLALQAFGFGVHVNNGA